MFRENEPIPHSNSKDFLLPTFAKKELVLAPTKKYNMVGQIRTTGHFLVLKLVRLFQKEFVVVEDEETLALVQKIWTVWMTRGLSVPKTTTLGSVRGAVIQRLVSGLKAIVLKRTVLDLYFIMVKIVLLVLLGFRSIFLLQR